jgi:ABC-type multidrug transport system permease subunit
MSVFFRLTVRNLLTTYDLKPALFASLLIPNLMYVFFAAFAYEKIIPPFTVNGVELDYPSFLAPGIVLMHVVSLSSLGGTMFWTDKHNGMLEQLLTLPVPRSYYFLSRITAILISSIVSGLAILLLSMPMIAGSVHIEYYSAGLFLVSITACCLIFAFLSILIFSFATTPEHVTVFFRLTTTPLIVMSSVFYPLESAPSLIRQVGYLNPLTYCADILRASLLGTFREADILVSLLLVLMSVSVILSARVIFDRKQLES